MSDKIDILIKGGTIVDGSGSEPFKGDVGIAGDKIVFINRKTNLSIKKYQVKTVSVIEARDMIVSPGFIDAHAHSDFTLLADPRAEGKICQGITTEINGNCGLSAAPLYGEALKQREGDFQELGIPERWTTLKEYSEILKGRAISLNFATLAGHGNLRACVAGYRDRKLTDLDRKEMCQLLKDVVVEGAVGLSTGLIYPPGVFSDTEELIELCRILSQSAKRKVIKSPKIHMHRVGHKRTNDQKGANCIYTSHMRSEGDKLIESVDETIRIAEESGIRVHISHMKTSGEKNWHKIDKVLSIIEMAKNKGLGITADRYPYTAASTDLDTILPSWVYEGGLEEEIKKLRSKDLRDQIKKEIAEDHPDKKYWENTYVSSVLSEKNRWMEGKSIASIARRKGHGPVDMLMKILIGEKLRVGAIFASMNEDNLKRFLSLPYVMIGTDSSARSFSGITCKGKPHPRGFGSFPRFLGKYVRGYSLMDLSEAIRKITCLPGATFGIKGRGMICEGAFADIVVFDFQKILDKATYREPFVRPEGIYYVIVNGRPALWEGELTDIRAGRVLRHGR
jgi:N-acyl-D-amino-acid deacylase